MDGSSGYVGVVSRLCRIDFATDRIYSLFEVEVIELAMV